MVDDRFGVLEVPEEETIVAPGETLCSTDLGLPVSYVATAADVGTTIVNNAVVTVRTVGAEPQAFQAADPAEVEILGLQRRNGADDDRRCRSRRWRTLARTRRRNWSSPLSPSPAAGCCS